MNTTGWAVAVVAVIIIAGGAWWFISTQPAATPQEQANATTTGTLSGTVEEGTGGNDQGMEDGVVVGGDASVTVGTPKTVTINYNGDAFSPSSVTINKGDTVEFFVSPGAGMWVASDEHPSHTTYDGTSRASHCASGYSGPKPFDQCGNGTQYSFTFTRIGTFEYHNHSQAQLGGAVIVK